MRPTLIQPSSQDITSFIREGFVSFTPQMAERIVTYSRYERQRDETRAVSHIATLSEQMRRGLWLPKTQIDFARVGGRIVLVNGHHRMRAQVMSGATILWNIVIHECRDDDELRSLYWRFDTHLRKRSANNILNGIGFAEQVGLPKEVASALWNAAPVIGAGMRFQRYQQDHRNILPDERLSICNEYVAHANFMGEAMKSVALPAVRKKLRAASQFAVAMVTLQFCGDKARLFWTGLCEDDALPKGDPRKALLVDMQSRSPAGSLLAAQMMAAARCWNAWHAGSPIKAVKVTGHPVRVNGTPFTVSA